MTSGRAAVRDFDIEGTSLYNDVAMANHAYLSVWSRDYSEETMLEQFRALLGTIPFSAGQPGLAWLVVRAVSPAEYPLVEVDLRGQAVGPVDVIELMREHLNADSAYEVAANWDLWVFDTETQSWKQQPQPLELICHGTEYDDGACREMGHFQVDAGIEHLFTGHARILGTHEGITVTVEHPAEAEFLAAMTRPENFREYHQKTRENIQKLMDWVPQIERALPVERYRLWSEGEENFEARLDEILAVR